jgi:hypothetical protein
VPWSRADLLAGQRHYVVTLTIGSRVLHYSHEALDIVQADGSYISVAAGLIADIDATRALQIQQTTVPLRSVSMSIITEAEDWAAIVADGYDLAAGVGELSEWIPGRTWEDRQIILTGLLDAPTYGARGEPLAFTLKNHPMQDRGQILPPTAIVDAQTWPNAHEHAEGRNLSPRHRSAWAHRLDALPRVARSGGQRRRRHGADLRRRGSGLEGFLP